MLRNSRVESRDSGAKSRGYQMLREKAFLKVAGTKCREFGEV